MKKKILSASILGISAVLIVIGILSKQNIEVFNKAVRVCLECVGIG